MKFLAVILIPGLLLSVTLAAAIIDPWQPYLTMPSGDKIHDLTVFKDPRDGHKKLVIAEGSGQDAGMAVIRFFDAATSQLTSEFQAPLNTYQGSPYWRSLSVFKGKLYAGLGDCISTLQCGSPDGGGGSTLSGQVWQFDGTSWNLVLQTSHTDIYTLGVWNGKLYAGAGTNGSKQAELWVSADGSSWRLLKQFPNADYVRSLAVFQDELYIGTRQRADLWSYDGISFTEYGAPPGIGAQVKSLVPSPNGSLLYLGCVKAQIWTWNGTSYTLSLDATATDSEIYKGTVYKGTIFFPTHGKDGTALGGGHIWRQVNGQWSIQYSTPTSPAYGQLQVVKPYDGYIYAGGLVANGTPVQLLRALY